MSKQRISRLQRWLLAELETAQDGLSANELAKRNLIQQRPERINQIDEWDRRYAIEMRASTIRRCLKRLTCRASAFKVKPNGVEYFFLPKYAQGIADKQLNGLLYDLKDAGNRYLLIQEKINELEKIKCCQMVGHHFSKTEVQSP